MRVIVDTCIWSTSLRRSKSMPAEALELRSLIADHRVVMLGPIRQEVLSGIRDDSQFQRLAEQLASFPDETMVTGDHVVAASFFNHCRRNGVQGSNTDFLISAVAVRLDCLIFTTDLDFHRYAAHVPVRFHQTPPNTG